MKSTAQPQSCPKTAGFPTRNQGKQAFADRRALIRAGSASVPVPGLPGPGRVRITGMQQKKDLPGSIPRLVAGEANHSPSEVQTLRHSRIVRMPPGPVNQDCRQKVSWLANLDELQMVLPAGISLFRREKRRLGHGPGSLHVAGIPAELVKLRVVAPPVVAIVVRVIETSHAWSAVFHERTQSGEMGDRERGKEPAFGRTLCLLVGSDEGFQLRPENHDIRGDGLRKIR